MNKLIAFAVALAVATPAFAQDAKKPANPAAANTPAVTTPAAKPADVTKPQPAAQKPGDMKKDEIKKDDVKKDEKKSDVKTDGKAPVTGQVTAPAGGQKTSEKPSEVKKQ